VNHDVDRGAHIDLVARDQIVLGANGAADDAAALQNQDAAALPGQITCRDQPIVASAHDDDVEFHNLRLFPWSDGQRESENFLE
jgi:hypothetical protein